MGKPIRTDKQATAQKVVSPKSQITSTKMSSSRDMVPISIRDPFFKDPFFSSTWEEFDKMRTDMLSSSKDFWGKVDKDFANFDEQVKRSHTDMDQSMAVFRPQLPKWAVSSGMPDAFNSTAFAGRNDEVMKVKQDDNKFEVTLDVSDYKPEEVKVEDSKDTGDARAFGSSAVMKQFSRKWTLPTDSDPADVVSNLSSDGVLMVTAPRKNAALKSNVPIKAIK